MALLPSKPMLFDDRLCEGKRAWFRLPSQVDARGQRRDLLRFRIIEPNDLCAFSKNIFLGKSFHAHY